MHAVRGKGKSAFLVLRQAATSATVQAILFVDDKTVSKVRHECACLNPNVWSLGSLDGGEHRTCPRTWEKPGACGGLGAGEWGPSWGLLVRQERKSVLCSSAVLPLLSRCSPNMRPACCLWKQEGLSQMACLYGP